MRPRGPTRQALRQAFEHAGGAPLTWRAMASFARVGFAVARVTVDNMVRAGELRVVGVADVPAGRPPRLFAPVDAPRAEPGADLVRCWGGVRGGARAGQR